MGGGQSRLNNSGYGRPPAAFRCPAIGGTRLLDLYATLAFWPGLAPADLTALETAAASTLSPAPRNQVTQARIPPATIASITAGLLHELGTDAGIAHQDGTAETAAALVQRLVVEVMTRGWHRTLFGLASPQGIPPHTWRSAEALCESQLPAQPVALTLAAFAVFRPPLLLWTRPPSLDWLRADLCISFRRLWIERSAA